MLPTATLFQGDCLDLMPMLAAGSVDLILCDPPYGTMKGLNGKFEWDVALEPRVFLEECNLVLRMNGALVLFSQEPYTSRLITEAHGNLPFCYRMIWLKDRFGNALSAKKAPVSYYEDVLVFVKRYDTLAQHPLHDYAARMLIFIGKPKRLIYEEMGHQGAFHWFLGRNSIQFEICTEDTYSDLCSRYGIDEMPGFLPYAEVKRADEEWRRASCRAFNLPAGQRHKSNVLTYRKDSDGFHPTQKPVALLEDLIATYSNAGDCVLDFTMGSGSTGVACMNTGRNFIGIEKDPGYFAIAEKRISKARREPEQPLLFAAE